MAQISLLFSIVLLFFHLLMLLRVNLIYKKTPYLQKDINLPDGEQPEKYINHILAEDIENQNAEIVALAKSIIEPDEPHKYLDDIINGLGDEEHVGLYKVIEELAKHPEWNAYTESVRNWLIKEKKDLGL